MYDAKKGELVAVLAIGVILIVGILLAWEFEGSITGAVVGLDVDDISSEIMFENETIKEITVNGTNEFSEENSTEGNIFVIESGANITLDPIIEDIVEEDFDEPVENNGFINIHEEEQTTIVPDEDLGIAVEATGSTCGDVSDNLTLTANISATGTCFEINTNHLTLDAAGFSITGDGASSEYGINSNGFDNVTVKNFRGILNFSDGLYIATSENWTVFNNTIMSANLSGSYGIEMLGGDGHNVSENIINNSVPSGRAISSSDTNVIIFGNNITVHETSEKGMLVGGAGSVIQNNFINHSVQGSGTQAIYVTASHINVTGNTIYHKSSVKGIYISGEDTNVSVVGNTIIGVYQSSSPGRAIDFWKINDSLISSNYISNDGIGEGIYLKTSYNNLITGNNVTATQDDAVQIESSDNNNITENVINGFSPYTDAVYLKTASNNSITYNNITTGKSYASSSNGVSLETSSHENQISNNIFLIRGDTSQGVNFDTSNFNNVSDNTFNITNTTSAGLNFATNALHNYAYNNNITINNHSGSYAGWGIHFDAGDNNTVYNGFINMEKSTYTHVLFDHGNGTLVNVSLEKDEIDPSAGDSKGSVFLKWYVYVNVTNSSSDVVSGVNVSAYNISARLEDNQTTDATGFTQLTLIEFYKNQSETIYHTPHEINASHPDYFNTSSTINLTTTETTQVNIILQDSINPSVTINTPISTYYNSDFVVNASVSDDGTVSSVQYRYENSSENGTWTAMEETGSYFNVTFDITSVSDGNYTFRINATDNNSNENSSVTVTNVAIDDTNPLITLNSPDNASNISTTIVIFNVTVTDTILKNVSLYINGTVNETNTSGTSGDYIFTKSLLNGNYTWYIEAFDLAENTNTSEVRNLTKDSLSCRTFTQSYTFSSGTLSATGDCFIIAASNIVVDGAGSTINGDSTGTALNITSGASNVTFQNFNLYDFNNLIVLDEGENNTLKNLNLINATNKDIIVNQSLGTDLNFTNVSFDQSNTQIGILSAININWVVDISTRSGAGVLGTLNVTVENLTGGVVANSTSSAAGALSLVITEYIETSGGKQYQGPHNFTAIEVDYNNATETLNLTTTNNTALTLDLAKILSSCNDLSSLTESVRFAQNNFSTIAINCVAPDIDNLVIDGGGSVITGDYNLSGIFDTSGLYIVGFNNIKVSNFEFRNFTYGVNIQKPTWNDTANNSLSNFVLVNNTVGVLLGFGTSNNNLTNFVIENGTQSTSDIELKANAKDSLIFTNVTFDKNNITSADNTEMKLRWFVDVQVNDTDGTAINNVTVKAYDIGNSLETSNTTRSNGVSRIAVTEFIKEEYGYTYQTPHRITASAPGYFDNETTLDISSTNNTNLNLTLQTVTCGLTVTNNFTLGSNLESNGTCFDLGSDGLVINGNGYTITGNNSGIAFNFSSKSNVQIFNLTITNFTTGIDLLNSDDGTFTGLTIENTTNGIVFNVSNGNKVYDSFFSDNTGQSVFSINDGATNNSLINVTMDFSDITVQSDATIFVKWYVDMNVTYNNVSNQLPNALVAGLFNDTNTLDYSTTTNINGYARLELSEFKVNSSGTFYLTPHNITSNYTLNSVTSINSSVVNLTLTNNTNVNYTLSVNCTNPYNGLVISSNTTLCPGTFVMPNSNTDTGAIKVSTAGVTLTCENTIMQGDTQGTGLRVIADDVTVTGCVFDNYQNGVYLYDNNPVNLTITNTNFTSMKSGGLYLWTNLDRFNLSNFFINWSRGVGYSFTGISIGVNAKNFNNSVIEDGTIVGIAGISVSVQTNITNNTFRALTLDAHGTSPVVGNALTLYGFNNTVTNVTLKEGYNNLNLVGTGNLIYNNTFQSATIKHATVTGENDFNTTVSSVAQGNSWDDYCALDLTDANSDGFADTGADYPYNETNDASVTGTVNDYGPVVLTCPSTTASGATTSTTTAAASGGSALPAAPDTPVSPQLAINYYSSSEVIEFLKTKLIDVNNFDKNTYQVTLTLENTGTKSMRLFPKIINEVLPTQYIVTKKTLGFEGSFFARLASFFYSKNSITEDFLESEIVGAEEIIIPPGGKLDLTLNIKSKINVPRQVKIQFTSFGDTVMEREIDVDQKYVSGTAILLNTEENLLDLYAVIVPEHLLANGKANGIGKRETYMLELNINKKVGEKERTSFSDLYGPYDVKPGQNFVFAQQFKYDPEVYIGDYVIRAKIYRDQKIVTETEADVRFE